MNKQSISTTSPAQNGDVTEGKASVDRRKVWDPETSITETEIVTADKNGAIKLLRIEKVGEVIHVFVKLTWRKEELFLTTTRTAGRPREFKDFTRLVEYIQKMLPTVKTFETNLEYAGNKDRRAP